MKLSKSSKYTVVIFSFFAFQIILAQYATAQLDPIPGVPDKSIPDVIEDATSWILGIAVAVSVVMLIFGGLYYVSSGGDTEKAATSKKIINCALIGVAIAGVSYAIVQVLDTIIG